MKANEAKEIADNAPIDSAALNAVLIHIRHEAEKGNYRCVLYLSTKLIRKLEYFEYYVEYDESNPGVDGKFRTLIRWG